MEDSNPLLWKEVLHVNGPLTFQGIIGHDNIKQIFQKAILSKKPVHLLLVGSPGSAKTMFLTEIMRSFKQSLFVVGSNTTKAGLVNQLFERRPKFLLIDELEKMSVIDQTALLHLMETGIISETKINKTRQIELTSWVFATANSCEKIITPLLSRFVTLEVPEYTRHEFSEIAQVRLASEKVDKHLTAVIAEQVWNQLESAAKELQEYKNSLQFYNSQCVQMRKEIKCLDFAISRKKKFIQRLDSDAEHKRPRKFANREEE